ncbi:hypothetical protein M2164_000174 [Streptomyces sp. SAI-208]|uniref:hypothetical protein n=1 Tax=Streptomyces sp. SAI-208 TaxID=2940550 RepID=UPI002473DFC7|nr:hypothetical protein [Streptomyces sp. SAI-208]MDH6604539.1 hypothetical protein [Streptomyces sp. SAI-208]
MPSLLGGLWPADADPAVLLLALDAFETPAVLPLTHRDKPKWGSGLKDDLADVCIRLACRAKLN